MVTIHLSHIHFNTKDAKYEQYIFNILNNNSMRRPLHEELAHVTYRDSSLYTVHYTLYSVRCKLYIVCVCTLYNTHIVYIDKFMRCVSNI